MGIPDSVSSFVRNRTSPSVRISETCDLTAASPDRAPHPNQNSTLILCRPVSKSGSILLQWTWTTVALLQRSGPNWLYDDVCPRSV